MNFQKMIKGAKNRVFDNIVTTILGAVVFLFVLYLVHSGKSSMAEATGWLTLGVALIRSKDSLLGLKAKDE